MVPVFVIHYIMGDCYFIMCIGLGCKILKIFIHPT